MDTGSLRFLKSHEWIAVDGNIATVGISHFAVSQLTDLTYVELPKVGSTVTVNDRFGEVESVKAVSDLYSPVSGEVIETNVALDEDVAPLSSDPYGAGWLMKVKMSEAQLSADLLDRAAYEDYCKSESH